MKSIYMFRNALRLIFFIGLLHLCTGYFAGYFHFFYSETEGYKTVTHFVVHYALDVT